jgi:hypothetical protein
MCIPPYSTLDELIDMYEERSHRDEKNKERVKKFYNDDESFDQLMEKLIQKDYKRFQKNIDNILKEDKSNKFFPTPWRFFFIILDIAQSEGEEIPSFDTLTRNFPSRSMTYHGWRFSWVHGENSLISIFNRKNELVYRF